MIPERKKYLPNYINIWVPPYFWNDPPLEFRVSSQGGASDVFRFIRWAEKGIAVYEAEEGQMTKYTPPPTE